MSETKLTPAEERVKAYLEEQIKIDTALAALYNPSKIKECYSYITDQARKAASSNSYFADDAEVWKWARDYFIEELPKKADQAPAIDVAPVKETVKEVTEQITKDAKNDNVKRDEYGFEVFGEEADEPEEAEQSAEEPCEQVEKEVEEKAEEPKEAEAIRYDEDGQALLFDFM